MKLDILAIGSHPDDIELGCGATLAKEVDRGKKVGALDLTQGELGTRGSATLRAKEAEAAAKILGLTTRENLGFADGFFINDETHQREVIKIIRKYRPDIVLCNAVEDRHIDHAKGSTLVSNACFLSGLQKIHTRYKDEDSWQDAWRPKHVYHYIQWKTINPDVIVDVSGYMEKKLQAVLAYSSQFYDPDSKEAETPISSKNFLESVTYRAQDLGRIIGVSHAEGFTTERCMAVATLYDLL